MSEISTQLLQMGFSFLMCGAMAWFVYYMYNKNSADIDKLNQRHEDEMKNITQMISNNTSALQDLKEAIRRLEP